MGWYSLTLWQRHVSRKNLANTELRAFRAKQDALRQILVNIKTTVQREQLFPKLKLLREQACYSFWD